MESVYVDIDFTLYCSLIILVALAVGMRGSLQVPISLYLSSLRPALGMVSWNVGACLGKLSLPPTQATLVLFACARMFCGPHITRTDLAKLVRWWIECEDTKITALQMLLNLST